MIHNKLFKKLFTMKVPREKTHCGPQHYFEPHCDTLLLEIQVFSIGLL